MQTKNRRVWLTALIACALLLATAGSYLGYVWVVEGGDAVRGERLDLQWTPEPPTTAENILFNSSLVAIVVALVVGAVAAAQLLPRNESKVPRTTP
jgi:hypothetical protein